LMFPWNYSEWLSTIWSMANVAARNLLLNEPKVG